ncbi:MAG: carboxypeptidase regulatory-like domain-containing protein [Bryobacteraceae bacterium]|nr:carboxypeptidase regulatory-like domain-containing protein [Bryobacteraceae bacterium]
MHHGRLRTVAVVAGVLLAAGVAMPAPPGALTGSLVGFVSNQTGVPQMGATVFLYNSYSALVARALTNEKGAFGFDSLSPGNYSIRVSLASFVPAVKEQINVRPGLRSFLAIHLASVLSSIELVYSAPGETKLMSDDWKWVLRSATATRPVLRVHPGIDITDPSGSKRETRKNLFTETRGLVRVAAGDQGDLSAAGTYSDLGTAFALATSLVGGNHLQVSGNLGYASAAGMPSAGIRTSFSRTDPWGAQPEVNVTMRQLFLPDRVGTAVVSGQGDSPALRTMAVSTLDRRRLRDNLLFEYGASLESVVFLNRLNFFSPYGRLTYELGRAGAFQFAYNSGMPPAELLTATAGPEMDLQQDLAVLSMFPRLSLMGGATRVQRTQNFEAAYRKVVGSRSVSVGIYRESTANAAVMLETPTGFYAAGDLLPDLSSNSSIFNMGSFERTGFIASVSQKLGEQLTAAVALGNTGVLSTVAPDLRTADPNELRNLMAAGRQTWLATRLAGVVPHLGTRFSTAYQFTGYGAWSPTHLYLTHGFQPELGLNIQIRQPLPSVPFWSGRLEATTELRNLLAQGYVPITTPEGRKLYLIQNPRAVRGGLSFIF